MDVFWVECIRSLSVHGRSKVVGELIHADVNGPMSVKSLRGAKYYVCFKDDYSKYPWIFFIKQKNEVTKCLCTFLTEVSTADKKVKMFSCDGGKEYACDEVCHVLSDCGNILLLLAPYAPEQNGVAERENRTIVVLEQSMLSVRRLPKLMWAQACETAVYVLIHTGKHQLSGNLHSKRGMVT